MWPNRSARINFNPVTVLGLIRGAQSVWPNRSAKINFDLVRSHQRSSECVAEQISKN